MSLRDEIHADPACATALAAKDCHELARIVSSGRQRMQSRYIGQGTVLDVMDNGGDFLDFLVQLGAQDRTVHWSIGLLENGRFDIGAAKAQAQLDLIALAQPQFATGIAALKALGYTPDIITMQDVAEAVFNSDGSEK